jgi:cytochrome oxidase assembly protein ShyY1
MLEKLPHKNLFYFGFIVVFVFIGLSYWQLTRYQQDKLIIDSIDSKDFINEISVSDLYDLNKFEEFTKIKLTENLENIDLIRTWYLRSRVHNGENGYHLVSLYGTELEEYFLINNGWVPLNKNADKTFLYKNPNFKFRIFI